MAVVNQETLDGLTKAYSTLFNKSLAETKTFFQLVAMVVASTTGSMDYAWLGSIPEMREWVGDKIINGLSKHTYTIQNKDYENTVGVKRKSIEDDQYGVYGPMIENLGAAAKRWQDRLTFDLLMKGFEETCYDGQYFFDADHPVGKGVVSNMQGGTGPAWYLMDTSRPIKPLLFQLRKQPEFMSQTTEASDSVFMRGEFIYGVEARGNVGYGLWQLAYASKADLTESNFKAARTAMESQKNDEGTPLAIAPNLLVVPPALRDAAESIINTDKIQGTNNTLYKAVELQVVPYLK